jgi:hypothetical protein
LKAAKAALTRSGMLVSKMKHSVVITDDEEDVGPQKKKAKVSGLEEDDSDINSDKTGLDEGPKRKKTCVFSQASEDAQDTCEKTEVSSDVDDSEDECTGEGNTTDARESDEEEYNYSQLDEMATKDAQVSNNR